MAATCPKRGNSSQPPGLSAATTTPRVAANPTRSRALPKLRKISILIRPMLAAIGAQTANTKMIIWAINTKVKI